MALSRGGRPETGGALRDGTRKGLAAALQRWPATAVNPGYADEIEA